MNVTVEKELFRNFSASASYVGALGRNLPASIDRNYPVFGPGATSDQLQRAAAVSARRAGCVARAGVDLHERLSRPAAGRGKAWRRGSRERRTTRYGKAVEDLDYQGGGLPAVQNSNDLTGERARTSADRTHTFSFSGIWQVNYFGDSQPLARALLNNWTLSTIVTLQSGAPLTITAGQDRNFDGNTNDRADLVGDPKLDSGRPREELIELWFNTAAFALPAVGADGSAPRSVVDGPGIRNVDLGVFRDIRLGGSTSLQFRLEATNVFNIVNLMNPGTNFGAPATFAKIRTAREMRRIQLGTRFSF